MFTPASSTYFHSFQHKITAAHIMASGALPPSFPPVEIEGQYYWDGGVTSNSPMQVVADNKQYTSALVFQVDLWDDEGDAPLDIASAMLRATEVHSASRINVSLEQYREAQKLRNALRKVLEELPEERRLDPEISLLAEEATTQVATLVQLRYPTKKYEPASKIFRILSPLHGRALARRL